ncbi:MAG: hypothetical protein WC593_15825 [Methanoregula sp.]
MREIHVGERRESGSFRAPKQGFFSFSTNSPPSGKRSPIQKAPIGIILGDVLCRIWVNGAIISGIAKKNVCEIRHFSQLIQENDRLLTIWHHKPPSEQLIF